MQAAAKVAVALAGLAAATLVQAQGPDEMWNITTRMAMDGMQMPGMTQQVCMKKGDTAAEAMAPEKDCKVTELRTVGNKTTWKVVCTGKDAMTGSGEMTRTATSLNGKIQMRDKDGDEMTMSIQGKLTGGCSYAAQNPGRQAAAAQAQFNASTVASCKQAIDQYATPLFDGPQAMCAAQKTEYCARVTKTGQSMRTSAGYRDAMGREGLRGDGWETAAKLCGVKAAELRADACRNGVSGRDWPFVAEYCPADSQKVAAQHCAGRQYTVAMSSEYKPICAKHASLLAQPAQQPAAAPTVADTAKEGVRALKKLFGN